MFKPIAALLILFKTGITQIQFSENPKILISTAQGNNLYIYDVFDGRCKVKLEEGSKKLMKILVKKDGSKLFASYFNYSGIHVWDVKNGVLLEKICCFDLEITVLEFSDKENFLTFGTNYGNIYIYRLTDGIPFNISGFERNYDGIKMYEENEVLVLSVKIDFRNFFSLYWGKSLNASLEFYDKEMRYLYFYKQNEEKTPENRKFLFNYTTRGIFSTPKTLLLFLYDNKNHIFRFIIYNFTEEKTYLHSRTFSNIVTSMSFNEKKGIIAVVSFEVIFILDSTNFSEIRRINGILGDKIISVDFSEDGRYLIAGYYNGTINIWDTEYDITIEMKVSGLEMGVLVNFINYKGDNNKYNPKNNQCYLDSNLQKNKYELGIFQDNNFVMCKSLGIHCEECNIIEDKIECLSNEELCGYKCLRCDLNKKCLECKPGFTLKQYYSTNSSSLHCFAIQNDTDIYLFLTFTMLTCIFIFVFYIKLSKNKEIHNEPHIDETVLIPGDVEISTRSIISELELLNSAITLIKFRNPKLLEVALEEKKFMAKEGLDEIYEIKINTTKYAVKVIDGNLTRALNYISSEQKVKCMQVNRIIWVSTKGVSNLAKVYIIKNYFNGYLQNYLEKTSSLTISEKIDILVTLAEGLNSFANFSKEEQLLHCDINPENLILIKKQKKILFSNYGLGIICKVGKYMNVEKNSSLEYAAPEVIKYKKANTNSDTYSFGLVALNVLGFKFKRFTRLELGQRVHDIDWEETTRNFRPPNDEIPLYRELEELTKSMLKYENQHRLCAKEILRRLQEIRKRLLTRCNSFDG